MADYLPPSTFNPCGISSQRGQQNSFPPEYHNFARLQDLPGRTTRTVSLSLAYSGEGTRARPKGGHDTKTLNTLPGKREPGVNPGLTCSCKGRGIGPDE